MTLNGTAGAYAHGIIRFWNLDEFKSLADVIENTKPTSAVIQATYHERIKGAESYFIFADFLHESQLYAIHLSLYENAEANHIIMLDGSAPIVVADNFSAFIDTYIMSPQSLRLSVD